MAKQYPYNLYVKAFEGEAIRNDKGQYTASGSDWVKISICRDEANSGGASIALEDQTVSVFDSLVQLPVYCPTVNAGAAIEVRDEAGTVRVAGSAKRFSRDQLHCRLWV